MPSTPESSQQSLLKVWEGRFHKCCKALSAPDRGLRLAKAQICHWNTNSDIQVSVNTYYIISSPHSGFENNAQEEID